MRPEKAIVIVSMAEIASSIIIDQIISEGICGRLVLRNSLISELGGENSIKVADFPLEGTQNFEVSDMSNFQEKVIYFFSQNLENIENLIQISLSKSWFCTLIFSELLPINNNLSEIAPKQSFQFLDCEEITNFLGSVFYVDFEKNYTRKD